MVAFGEWLDCKAMKAFTASSNRKTHLKHINDFSHCASQIMLSAVWFCRTRNHRTGKDQNDVASQQMSPHKQLKALWGYCL